MAKTELKVGIIDDEQAKATDIKTKVKLSGEFILNDKTYSLNPVIVEVKPTIEEMISIIKEKRIDALIIDYVLTRKNANYKGVELAKAIMNNFGEYPIFILTSYAEDLFNTENISVYNVYNYGYFNDNKDPNYRKDVFNKIVKEIVNYKEQVDLYDNELKGLIEKENKTADDIDKIQSLSSKIEKHILNVDVSISKKTQIDFTSNKLVEIMEKIEKKLESLNEDSD